MKNLKQYITEKLKITKDNSYSYKYFTETRDELKQIIKERIENEGPECDLNDIDVSQIKNMTTLFYYSNFNGNISKWDPKNIIDSCYMFDGCSHFNQDLSNWNMQSIHSRLDREDMFYACPLDNNKQKQPKFNI